MVRPQFFSWLVATLLVTGVPGRAAELPDTPAEVFVPIAEEVLDAAIEHCRRGQMAQARALFAAIRDQLDPPQSVRELILALEQGGCTGRQAAPGQWELRALAGYDDNVSQGIRSSSLTLGPAAYNVELVVDDNYRPISSSFFEMAAGRSWEVADRFTLQVKAGGRQYPKVRSYDLANVNATLKTRLNALGRPIDWMAEWAELWMGGRRYHTAWAMAAQAPVLPDVPQWNYAAVAQKVNYHTQPQQNAAQLQFGLNRQFHPGPGKALLMGVMGIWDHAQGQRAGGGRVGANFHAIAQIRLQPWLLTGRMSVTHWATRQDFLPGLVDAKRRNTLLQANAQAEYPLSANQTLQLDFQIRDSRDTIALYAYRSYSLGVSWMARF